MSGRSALDRFAIVAIVVAGLVEAAQQSLSHAPAVTKAYPVLNLDGAVWNYVPLTFVGLAALFWAVDWGLRIFLPSYALARTSSIEAPSPAPRPSFRLNCNWNILGPSLAAIGVLGAIFGIVWLVSNSDAEKARVLAVEPQMKMAPVIRGTLTLAYVKQVIQSQDPVTAETTLSKYLGTPMRASGTIHSSTATAGDIYTLALTPTTSTPQVYLIFHSDRNTTTNNVSAYNAGDHIAADCKIERADASGLGLDGCELIPDEAWTGEAVKPSQL